MPDVTPRFKVPRIRDPGHLARIRTLSCSVSWCQTRPVIAHHLTCSPEPKARGLKAGDNWVVPLCEHVHHTAQSWYGVHNRGDERVWWGTHAIDPLALAERLWAETQTLRVT